MRDYQEPAPPPPTMEELGTNLPEGAMSDLRARLHDKCIEAAKDAAEHEVLKARNARLKAQQVRLLSALEKARELVKCAASLNNEDRAISAAACLELIELIDLLRLECEKDNG